MGMVAKVAEVMNLWCGDRLRSTPGGGGKMMCL